MKKLEMNGTTPKQRRMAVKIATDVLLTMKSLTISPGRYLLIEPKPSAKVQCVIVGEKIEKNTNPSAFRNCTVCARGAMFISRARLFDEVVLAEKFIVPQTAADFGLKNAALIETAFEKSANFALRAGVAVDLVGWAMGFYDLLPSATKRLRAIMKNVIANKGVFRP